MTVTLLPCGKRTALGHHPRRCARHSVRLRPCRHPSHRANAIRSIARDSDRVVMHRAKRRRTVRMSNVNAFRLMPKPTVKTPTPTPTHCAVWQRARRCGEGSCSCQCSCTASAAALHSRVQLLQLQLLYKCRCYTASGPVAAALHPPVRLPLLLLN